MQPTTPVLGVTGIQPPASLHPAVSGSMEPPNKRQRIDDDPLSRYPGFKRYQVHNRYNDMMMQIAAEIAASVSQYLLLANWVELKVAGVEIVMNAHSTKQKFLIWPGMTVPPQRVDWCACIPSAVQAMMTDQNFKQVLSTVPGVRVLTPEQAEQHVAQEKDKAATQEAQSMIKKLEDVSSLIASVKQLKHVEQSHYWRTSIDQWAAAVDKRLEPLRSTSSTLSMMVSRQAITTDIRTFLTSVTKEASEWLCEDAQSVFFERLRIMRSQDAESKAYAASANNLTAEVTQPKQKVTLLEQKVTSAEQLAAAAQQKEQAALQEVDALKKVNAEAEVLLVNNKQMLDAALMAEMLWLMGSLYIYIYIYMLRCRIRVHGSREQKLVMISIGSCMTILPDRKEVTRSSRKRRGQ